MSKRNKSKGKLTIRTKEFIALLKQVFLGGVIEDTVVVMDGKKCMIEAVDISNHLVVITSSKMLKQKSKELIFGLSNIKTLIKFFETIQEPITIMDLEERNKLVFSRKDKRRKMKYVLADPTMIATILEKDEPDEDTAEIFREMQEYKMPLTRAVIKDFHSYISLVKPKSPNPNSPLSQVKPTKISYAGDAITITIGSSIENQYIIEIDSEVEDINGDGDDFSLDINGEFLDRIFSVIEFDEDNPPYLWVGAEKPMLVTSGDTIWALLPSAGDDDQEE